MVLIFVCLRFSLRCKLKFGVLIFMKIFGGLVVKYLISLVLIFSRCGKWLSIFIKFIMVNFFILNRDW